MADYTPTEAEMMKSYAEGRICWPGPECYDADDEWRRGIERIKADVRAEERAKRPDREQIAQAIYEANPNFFTSHPLTPWEWVDDDVEDRLLKLAVAVLASFPDEPEAREEVSRGD